MNDVESSSPSEDDRIPDGNFFRGTEPFLAVFTQTQVILSSVRLTFDECIAHNTSDLGARIESARRAFVHSGNVSRALQDIGRISADYRQRIQNWEVEARRRENNKSKISGDKIAKMKAEHSRVRNTSNLGARAITKLEVEIHQLNKSTLKRDQSPESTPGVVENNVDVQTAVADKPVVSEEELGRHTESIYKVLKSVTGDVLVISHSEATRKAEAGAVEQGWNTKQPLVLAVRWQQVEKDISVGYKEVVDYSLAHENVPVVHRNFRLWFIPVTLVMAESLKIAIENVGLTIAARNIEQYRIDVELETYESLKETNRLPSSKSIAEFVEKVRSKFATKEAEFTIGVAEVNRLELAQNQLLLRLEDGAAP